jgi:hypothetical protein
MNVLTFFMDNYSRGTVELSRSSVARDLPYFE